MKRIFSILFLFILWACTASKFSKDDYLNYSSNSSFSPSSQQMATGCYITNSNFEKTEINLLENKKFTYSHRSSLYELEESKDQGTYEIKNDSLLLNSKSSTSNILPSWLFKKIDDRIFLMPSFADTLFGEIALDDINRLLSRKNGETYGQLFPLKVSTAICN